MGTGTTYGRIFKLRLIPVRTLQSSEDISVELKVGVENIPADSNPIFVLTDEKDGHYWIGIRILDSFQWGLCHLTERQTGHTLGYHIFPNFEKKVTLGLLPDQYVMTVKPKEKWRSCYCAAANISRIFPKLTEVMQRTVLEDVLQCPWWGMCCELRT